MVLNHVSYIGEPETKGLEGCSCGGASPSASQQGGSYSEGMMLRPSRWPVMSWERSCNRGVRDRGTSPRLLLGTSLRGSALAATGQHRDVQAYPLITRVKRRVITNTSSLAELHCE